MRILDFLYICAFMCAHTLRWCFFHDSVFSFQAPSASSPCAPVLPALILNFPVTHGTCTASLTTLATATAGLCSAPGVASASPLFLASSAPWLPPFSQSTDPPAPSPDRRMAPFAKRQSLAELDRQTCRSPQAHSGFVTLLTCEPWRDGLFQKQRPLLLTLVFTLFSPPFFLDPLD